MNKRMYYYLVAGKNGYIPKHYYTKAESIKDARIHFYIEAGDSIESTYRISKKSYNERNIEK